MKRVKWLLLACLLVFSLTACGDKPTVLPENGADGDTRWVNQLTADELAAANEALATTVTDPETHETRATVVNGFFLSTYDTPQALPLERFLCLFPTGTLLTDEDADEFAALAALPDFPHGDAALPSDLPVPTHRFAKADVDAALLQYAGITTDDLTDTAGVLYLPEYDAYYNFTSDFGAAVFTCTGGVKDGDTVRLWGDPIGETAARRVLTLHRQNDQWLIQSFCDED